MYREFRIERATAGKQCPVCNAGCFEDSDQWGVTRIICPTCGKFRFGPGMEIFFRDPRIRGSGLGYKLSHFFRSISERALGRPDYSLFPAHTLEDLQRILDKPDPPVREKLIMLLRYFAGLSSYPGHIVVGDPANDYAVLCAKNRDETDFYIKALEDEGLIAVARLMTREPDCAVTPRGWQELERVDQSGADSPNGFIAMRFDPSQDRAKESIKAAITAAGYYPIRMDEVEHANRIDDEMLAKIRQSRFLVADFTGQSHGVYFEAGFMLALERTVIWICSKSDFDNVHFDTRQYNTIVYADAAELKTRLQFRIEAMLGKGPISA